MRGVVQPRHPRAEHHGAVPAAAGKLPAVHRPLQLQLSSPYRPERRAGGGAVPGAGNSGAQPAADFRAAEQPGAVRSSAAIRISTPETADTYHVRRGVAVERRGRVGATTCMCRSTTSATTSQNVISGALRRAPIIGRCFNQLDANPDFDPRQRVLPVVQPQSEQLRNHGCADHDAEPVRLGLTGVDLWLDWKLPLGENGSALGFKLLATRTLSVEQQETVDGSVHAREGTISQTVASAFPEWKAVLTTGSRQELPAALQPALHRRHGRREQQRDPEHADRGRQAAGAELPVPRPRGALVAERHVGSSRSASTTSPTRIRPSTRPTPGRYSVEYRSVHV